MVGMISWEEGYVRCVQPNKVARFDLFCARACWVIGATQILAAVPVEHIYGLTLLMHLPAW